MTFADRRDAGRRLAQRLRDIAVVEPVVLALPRGGVPVAYEVARTLGAPMDVLVARKIGAPFQPELGVGALAEGGGLYLDDAALRALRLTPDDLQPIIERERVELQRRVAQYRAGRDPLPVAGRAVLVVDDGLATGGTARAALRAVRARGAGTVVLAVPVGPPEARTSLLGDADQVVILEAPERLSAVGQWYVDFSQTSDREVLDLLQATGGAD